jgi:hypothetical protein
VQSVIGLVSITKYNTDISLAKRKMYQKWRKFKCKHLRFSNGYI